MTSENTGGHQSFFTMKKRQRTAAVQDAANSEAREGAPAIGLRRSCGALNWEYLSYTAHRTHGKNFHLKRRRFGLEGNALPCGRRRYKRRIVF